MKILYLNTTGTLGGAELCLLDVMTALKQARPEWALAAFVGEDGPLRTGIEALGARGRVMPLPASVARLGDASLRGRDGKSRGRLALAFAAAPAAAPAAAYLARLKTAIREEKPDRIHTINLKAHVLGAWAAPKNVPVIWHLHDYVNSRPVMARLLRLAARRGISGVGVSRSVAEDAEKALRGRIPVSFEYNAVDLTRFAPDGPRLDLDAASGLPPAPERTVRLGLVATFAHWKGHDVFLEAAAKAKAQAASDRPCRFYIVGGPIYLTTGSQWSLDDLKSRAEALGLGESLGFAGHQTDPSAAMRALDVIVHASIRPEPFGRVIIEGMACGKAVIAVSGGGSAELFVDNETALGIPAGDPEALAQAMLRLISDESLRARLGRFGRESAVSRFDRSHLGDRWAARYVEG